jgi:2-polyprenyl-6-methoxyphenol hydroxylase-like FAD-dependent oxidoreductase
MSVAIVGDGVAAATCGYLLQSAGIAVATEAAGRARLPAIMLSQSAQALFRDIFELEDAFRGQLEIRQRVVKWGSRGKPVRVPHSAVVVSEEVLLETIRSKPRHVTFPPDDGIEWTIVSTPPPQAPSVEHAFGSRNATVVPVQLKERSDPAACWIESLDQGWLFLLPGTSGSGWLLSVGAQLESHIESSRIIAAEIEQLGEPAGVFPSHPRVCWPLCGERWLACGTAALGFDPLCGDGMAHAVNLNYLLAHYEARLLSGFKRHLGACREFYESGGPGPWWDSAASSVRQGLMWCDHRLTQVLPFRYRLSGLELEEVTSSR